MKTEVYAPASEIEAQRIYSFLQSEGIDVELDISDVAAQIPTIHRITILTSPDHRRKAIELIANARLDQVITDTGTFL